MVLAVSIGFVLFIARTLGIRAPKGNRKPKLVPRSDRKRSKSRSSARLALALLAFAVMLTLVVALSIRWILGLLEKTLT